MAFESLKIKGGERIFKKKFQETWGIAERAGYPHANQVWCTDITYIPMRHGFMYQTAMIDVYSRMIVGRGISNPLSTQWCKNVLQDAISKYGKPEIINPDQGTQYGDLSNTITSI